MTPWKKKKTTYTTKPDSSHLESQHSEGYNRRIRSSKPSLTTRESENILDYIRPCLKKEGEENIKKIKFMYKLQWGKGAFTTNP